MDDQASGGSSIFWDSMLFVFVGVFLTFFYVWWVRWSTVFFNKNDVEKQQKLQASMLTPWRVLLFRVIGVISLLFGGLGAWLGSGHAIPSFTG